MTAPRTGSTRAASDNAATVRVIARRLGNQREQLASRVVERCRQEIIDYRSPANPHLLTEAFDDMLAQIDVLVTSLQAGQEVPDEYLERARQVAARRVHEGVSLESLLHAARLWANECWHAVLSVARIDSPAEREAALDIATLTMAFADRLSTGFTQAYLDEITDRGLLRRDLLDALLTAKGEGSQAVQIARRLHLRLEEHYIVVVVHADGVEAEEARQHSPAASLQLDRMVHETRRAMRPSDGSLLTGMRNGDLVVLCPASSPVELDVVKHDCQQLAALLKAEVNIGVSGWHEGRGSVGLAYAEAKDAAAIATRLGITSRAVGLDEVLVDHMLESSASARGMLEDILRPLLAYDAARQADLVPTLRAYLRARFNVTKAAEGLFVNPNTVVYRLRRIRDLTGRDTHDLDDLVLLYLALKREDLHASGSSNRGSSGGSPTP